MKYSKVYIESFGYELAPNIMTTEDIENQLTPFFETINFGPGLIEGLTGIKQRRFWDKDHTLAEPAAAAAQKALAEAEIEPDQIDTLVFCGVGQDGFEPATSCAVADLINIKPHALIYDVKNACLGMLTGMVQVANQIELGQIRAGLVVSCETARQIVESTIKEINQKKDMEFYKEAVATLTGGSGAAAILLTDGSFANRHHRKHQFFGGILKNAIQHHGLCSWGFEQKGMPTDSKVIMRTQAQGVLEHGLTLVKQTFEIFRQDFGLLADQPDKFIGHQVGSLHHKKFYETLNVDISKDFCTYPFLGNMGSVALPATAAIADERGFLQPEDIVAFIGVGSGLNCAVLGVKW